MPVVPSLAVKDIKKVVRDSLGLWKACDFCRSKEYFLHLGKGRYITAACLQKAGSQ